MFGKNGFCLCETFFLMYVVLIQRTFWFLISSIGLVNASPKVARRGNVVYDASPSVKKLSTVVGWLVSITKAPTKNEKKIHKFAIFLITS